MTNTLTKEQRLDIVNKLIKHISENGRHFFSKKGDVAFMKLKNGRLYFVDDYTKTEIAVINNGCDWRGFSHGGTLRALVLDFATFIRTGKESDGKHGYGGLHGTGWGHSPEVQKNMIDYAVKIGYLS